MKHYWYLFLSLLITAPAFADDGKVSNTVFFKYNFHSEENTPDKNGFEISRAYLTYQRKISDDLNLKFQADVGRLKDSTNTNLYAYLKNARVSWKMNYGTLIIGLQGMNIFEVQEKTWGHRFIEKSAMDLNKFSSSADLGIGYTNSFTEKFQLSLLITNGSGYKKPETDIYKKYSLMLVYGTKRLDKGDGFNFGTVFSYEPYKDINLHENKLGGLFAGYAGANIRVGGEFSLLMDSGTNKTKQLASVYGTYFLNNAIQIFSRLDSFKEDSAEMENLLFAGFIYTPHNALLIAPNYRISWDTLSSQNYNVNFQFKF